ncbi:helix-turn-helix transcriptional regulator [Gilvimarinus sp. SDUM040013]|uniref:Helix-turn-helix transcriptional regulator n=1 Tax=Gilvimarinus gilvus TaxID=3058038 RepID=A0ABU4RUZ9_9GAMM|nr:helix-turn-helix transcriptional regulator [Gilvimarinus sp. SDUM040013]MDO3387932.1 helix-turn-helix transcriptional regulator [Gilvimarinus sp. SDUM040013]MDX6848697.1 helix-turn-helix transcriptional regulator [Gilvimarinus sp. SDUM040013]
MPATPLLEIAKRSLSDTNERPFSVYSSLREQRLLNVPIIKPLLIVVLEGEKQLGQSNPVSVHADQFVLLSNNPSVHMRNVPSQREYFALLIEFEFDDFLCLHAAADPTPAEYVTGHVDELLNESLRQFVGWSEHAPRALWAHRRQELLKILLHGGHTSLCTVAESHHLSNQLFRLVSDSIGKSLSAKSAAQQLSISEASLRRKLALEGTSFQVIKDQVRLTHGLHLLQTTHRQIGLIAGQCGYSSASRFTDKFKTQFGITPSELRSTRMSE